MMDYEKLCEMYTVNGECVDMEIYNELKQKKLVQIKKHLNFVLKLYIYSKLNGCITMYATVVPALSLILVAE